MNPRDLETASQFVKLLRVLSDPQGVAKTIADIEAATAEYKKTKAIVDTLEAAQAEASKIMAVADQVRQSTAADKDLFAKTMTAQLAAVAKRETDVLAREEAVHVKETEQVAKADFLGKKETAVSKMEFAVLERADKQAAAQAQFDLDVKAFEEKIAKFNSLVGK